MELIKREKTSFILMCMLVFLWGLDYVFAKSVLSLVEPLVLLFLKYCVGAVVLFAIKMKLDRNTLVRVKDIPWFLLCALSGEVLYFYCEYSALDYLPVSIMTMMLSFVPIVSIIVERVLYKKKFNGRILIGILVSVAATGLIIGTDLHMLLSGRWQGYLLAAGAVSAWNIYNFMTAKVGENYTSITMSFNQLICTVLMSLPFAIHNIPPASDFTFADVASIIYLGAGSAGVGYLILIKGIKALGPTITSIFSNLLPITATFFGWLILGEHISLVQMAAGLILIAASCLVIVEKGKLEVS